MLLGLAALRPLEVILAYTVGRNMPAHGWLPSWLPSWLPGSLHGPQDIYSEAHELNTIQLL